MSSLTSCSGRYRATCLPPCVHSSTSSIFPFPRSDLSPRINHHCGGAFSVHISSENGLKAYVTEGEEVLTLRPEERGTQKLFVPHKYNSKRKWEPSLMEWCCVKRCTNQEWTDMFERLREVSRKIGVKNAGQRMAGLGKVAWRKTEREPFLSARKGLDAAFNRKSELRESLFGSLERGHTQSIASL